MCSGVPILPDTCGNFNHIPPKNNIQLETYFHLKAADSWSVIPNTCSISAREYTYLPTHPARA